MYEEICYRNNYVSEVICRLDFASPINELRSNMPKIIYDAVKESYPIAEPRNVIGTQLQITPVNGPTFNQVMTKQWVFLSRDRLSSCIIESESIVFSAKNYINFEEYSNAILDILRTVMKTFPENQGKRLGLRYINDIPMKGHTDWIETKFFDALSAHKDEKTTKLITTLEYAVIEKDLGVRLQYGYVNPDYPAIMKRENFVIDIDAYTTSMIYCEDLEQLIDDTHCEDQKCYETMITDALRKDMNTKV